VTSTRRAAELLAGFLKLGFGDLIMRNDAMALLIDGRGGLLTLDGLQQARADNVAVWTLASVADARLGALTEILDRTMQSTVVETGSSMPSVSHAIAELDELIAVQRSRCALGERKPETCAEK
jgi:hypothetical protein